jgi:diguanylate cyclase (GGDEF)-like protein
VIDADNLKALNDAGGHSAGDALLRDIATVLRANLRSYDPLVRTGGDEFVCTIAGFSLERSRGRLAEVSAALAQVQPGASISVGLAEMRDGDTLEALLERGDAALYQDKRGV